jgi:CMP-N,N'-diacetyllegionaminic acid synthase
MSAKSPYYLGVIPARGGSKRLPRKNLIPLHGKPLIGYSIEAARRSQRLSRTVVSTDDAEIAEVARALGGDVPFIRPAEMARDESAVLPCLRHALAQAVPSDQPVDAVVLLQPTSPLRTHADIDAAIALFEETGADTVTAVRTAREHPYYVWTRSGERLVPYFSLDKMNLVRQELPPALVENGALYVIRTSVLEKGLFYGETIVPYVMDETLSTDIDTAKDLETAERVLVGRAKTDGER